jgi:hypothetical protein
VSLIGHGAEITGYAVWGLAAWALANRAVTLLCRAEDERRRWRNARRMERFTPRARPRDTAHDETRVMPGISRPRAPTPRLAQPSLPYRQAEETGTHE